MILIDPRIKTPSNITIGAERPSSMLRGLVLAAILSAVLWFSLLVAVLLLS